MAKTNVKSEAEAAAERREQALVSGWPRLTEQDQRELAQTALDNIRRASIDPTHYETLLAGAPGVNAVRVEDLAPHAVLRVDGDGVLRTWEGAVVLGAEGRALRQDDTEGGR